MVDKPFPSGPMPMQGRQPSNSLEEIYEPFYIEPVTAWRVWKIKFDDRRGIFIQSITYPMPWLRRKPVRAHCLSAWKLSRTKPIPAHNSPNINHACGIYSVKKIEDAMKWMNYGTSVPKIIGQVSLWGKIFQFTDGYMAEYAYPKSLFVPEGFEGRDGMEKEDLLELLKDAYGVETTIGFPLQPE